MNRADAAEGKPLNAAEKLGRVQFNRTDETSQRRNRQPDQAAAPVKDDDGAAGSIYFDPRFHLGNDDGRYGLGDHRRSPGK